MIGKCACSTAGQRKRTVRDSAMARKMRLERRVTTDQRRRDVWAEDFGWGPDSISRDEGSSRADERLELDVDAGIEASRRAREVLAEVRQERFPSRVLLGMVAEGEWICLGLPPWADSDSATSVMLMVEYGPVGSIGLGG